MFCKNKSQTKSYIIEISYNSGNHLNLSLLISKWSFKKNIAKTITKFVEKSALLKQTREFKTKLIPIKNCTNGNQLAFR